MIRRPPRSTLFPYTDALPIYPAGADDRRRALPGERDAEDAVLRGGGFRQLPGIPPRSEEHTSELQSRQYLVCRLLLEKKILHSVPPSFFYVPCSSRVSSSSPP